MPYTIFTARGVLIGRRAVRGYFFTVYVPALYSFA